MTRYRKTQRGGGLFSAIEHEQAVAAKTNGILKLRDLIPWESFRPLLEDLAGYATRDWKKGGKPPFDPVLMFKVLVLQKFHGLSDDATEEQIFDRTSFKSFLGLRIGEGLNLKIGDIDRANNRVHIRLAKGNKSRYAKLAEATYQLLRCFWATHRNPQWIFPSTQKHKENTPMDRGSAQKAIRLAVAEAGIHKHITAHSLRHCYATHLIESGLNLRAVQDLLGHEDPRTTALYTQLTTIVQQDATVTINLLASRIHSPLTQGE